MVPPAARLRLLLTLSCLLAGAFTIGLVSGCGSGSTPPPAAAVTPAPPPPVQPATPPANPFSKVVVLGDSLSAGFQNGSLLDTQQPNGWASLVAQQAGFQLTLPLIAPPGVPAVIQLISAGIPPVLQQASGTSIGRDNPSAQVTDFAVPGHKLYDLLNTAPVAQPATGDEIIASLVLGYPAGTTGTQIQQAIAQKPSTIFLWIGGDDALPADGKGDPSAMTPIDTFTTEFTQLMTTLKANTTAHLFVANIPDVTEIPYLTQANELISEAQALTGLTGLSPADAGLLLGITPGDLINPNGLLAVEANIRLLEKLQPPVPLPAADVLTPSEAAQVQSTIASYNQVIASQVAAAGGTLVDVHSYIDTLAASGLTISYGAALNHSGGSYAASTLYLGGLFGLDGIHPSNTGYALIANQFIASANAALGTTVALVDVSAVAAKDPLFGPNRPSSALPYARTHISPAAGKAADAMIFGFKQKP